MSNRSKLLSVLLLALLVFELGAGPWLPVWVESFLLAVIAVAVVLVATAGLGRGRAWPLVGAALTLLGAALEFGDIALLRRWLGTGGVGHGWLLAGVAFGTLAAGGRAAIREAGPKGVLLAALGGAILGRLLATPLGYHAEEGLAGMASTLASIVLPGTTSLDPTYSGVRHALAAAIVLFALGAKDSRSSWKSSATVAAIFAGATVLICAIVSFALAALPEFGSDDAGAAERAIGLSAPWLPLVLWSVAIVLFARTKARAHEAASVRPVLGGLAAAWCVASIAMPTAPASARPTHYAVYEKGLLSWGAPNNEDFGQYSVGMLGTLPPFLEASGAEVTMIPSLRAANFDGCDALVVINLDHELPQEDLDDVQDFVEAGGSLFVVGDHTFLEPTPNGHRIVINDVLPTDRVAFINDSADQLSPGWDGATVLTGPGRDHRREAGNPSGILVGGSLDLGLTAAPLLVGRHGYSDLGIDEPGPGNHGYLGDLLWNRGERLGSVVTGAWAPLGAGRVLVVGDTTGLTNYGRMWRWDWWSRFFTLDLLPTPVAKTVEGSLAALLAALLFAGTLVWRRLRPEVLAPVAVAALAASTLHAEDQRAPILDGDAPMPLAVIDLSCQPMGRLGSWEMDGAAAVPVNLHRLGMLPLFHRSPGAHDLEYVDHVLMQPAQVEPTDEHVATLLDWVDEGGSLLICAGHDQAKVLSPLFDEIDAWIAPTVMPAQRGEWVNHANPPAAPFLPEPWWLGGTPDWRPRVLVGDRMVIGEREFGDGRITIVADPMFLSNHTLEGKWGHNEGNLALFRELVNSPLTEVAP